MSYIGKKIQRLQRLFLLKKSENYKHLSGGRWITVTKPGPLHGRHLYISDNGTILAGKVPSKFHGKNLSEINMPHPGHPLHDFASKLSDEDLKSQHEHAAEGSKAKEVFAHHLKMKEMMQDAPHVHMSTAHHMMSQKSVEELQDAVETHMQSAMYYEKKGNESAEKYHEKMADVAEHHLKQKNAGVSPRNIPDEAPHQSKQPIHNTMSQKTPSELKAIIKEAKQNIKDGSGSAAFNKKKIAVATYYLNGGSKPDFDAKKKTDTKEKDNASNDKLVEDMVAQVENQIAQSKKTPEKESEIPHPEMDHIHKLYSEYSAEKLQERIDMMKKDIKNAEEKNSSPIKSALVQNLKAKIAIAEYHLQQKKNEELDEKLKEAEASGVPHPDSDAHTEFSKLSAEQLKNKIKIIDQEMPFSISDKQENLMKEHKAIAEYYLNKLNDNDTYHAMYKDMSLSDLELSKKNAENLISENPDIEPKLKSDIQDELAVIDHYIQQKGKEKPHSDMILAHNVFSSMSVPELEFALQNMHQDLASGQSVPSVQLNTKKKIKIAEHYLKQHGIDPHKTTEIAKQADDQVPHADKFGSLFHESTKNQPVHTLQNFQTLAIDKLSGDTLNAEQKQNYKQKLEVVQHWMKQKGASDLIKPIPDIHEKTHTAMDDFHNPTHTISTEAEHVGTNLSDHGIDQNDSNQVHKWKKQIDHHSMGYTWSEIQSMANKAQKTIEKGILSWGFTNSDPSDAKANSQRHLVEKLHHDDDFMQFCSKALGHGKFDPNKTNTAEERKEYAKKAVRHIISSWASSSGDHNALSVATQLAAQEEFQLTKSYAKFDSGTMSNAHDKYLSDPETKSGMKKFVRQMYDNTQEFFKQAGITHIPLIRGMSFSDTDPISHIELNKPTKAKMMLQPLSSFSTVPSTAETFTGTVTGGPGVIRVMTAAMIPVERIMGHPQTGFGCMNEQEFVVLGGANQLDDTVTFAWNHYGAGKKGFHASDMQQFLSDPKFNTSSSSGSVDASGFTPGHIPQMAINAGKSSKKTIAANAKEYAKKIHSSVETNGTYDEDKSPKDNLHPKKQYLYNEAIAAIKNSKDWKKKIAPGGTDEQYDKMAHIILKTAINSHISAQASKPKKTVYHVVNKQYWNGGYHKKAISAKAVPHDPKFGDLELFTHKQHGGYKVAEKTTGLNVSSHISSTPEYAIETAKNLIDKYGLDAIKEKISGAVKVPDNKLYKSMSDQDDTSQSYYDDDEPIHDEDGTPIIYPDKDLHNADWTKQSWDLPKIGTPEFKQWFKNSGYTIEQFKETPAYKHLSAKQKKKLPVMKKTNSDSEKDYYPSDRYAYKTHTRNPIYIPVNRLQTPYQTEDALDEDKVQENVQKIKNGEALSPIVIGYNHDVHDGHHRLEAAKRVGHTHVPCVVRGRNPRRVIAANKKYRELWKSERKYRMSDYIKLGDDSKPPQIYSEMKKSDARWVTIKDGPLHGRHIKIDDSGRIIAGKGIPKHVIEQLNSKSNAYKNASNFGKIPIQQLPDKAENAIRKHEESIRNLATEVGTLHNPETGELIWHGDQGHTSQVDFTDARNKGLIKGNVLTHNHPGGTSFSGPDIGMMLANGLKEIRVVTKDRLYRMSPPIDYVRNDDNFSKLMSQIQDISEDQRADFVERIKNKTLTVEEANATHNHEVWKKVAKQLGFRYQVIERTKLQKARDPAKLTMLYHATNNPDLKFVGNREIKDYNQIGSWFSSDPEKAWLYYGPYVYEVKAQIRNPLYAETEDFTRFFYNPDIAPKFLNLGADKMNVTREDMTALMNNPDYVRAFKADLETRGYDAIIWEDSLIDVPLESDQTPHTVTILLHPETQVKEQRLLRQEEIHARGEVTMLAKSGRLLLAKKSAPLKAGERWVTIRGNHVKINGDGEIVEGPKHLKGIKLKPQSPKKAESGTRVRQKEAWENQKKTPFDTKEIVEARANAKNQLSTHKRDYYFSPERKKLRAHIANTLLNEKGQEEAKKGPHGKVLRNRRIDLVMGPPAAGKSTVFADPLAREHGSLIIDSDMAKEMLPEFDGGKGAGIVHEESAQIVEAYGGGVFHQALSKGMNIVLPLVGKNAEKIIGMRDDLKAIGYEVHIHLNDLPKEEATKRAVARFYSTGRFVDPDYVHNDVGNRPAEAYEKLKQAGGFDSYEKYSNNVKKGEKPIVIESIKGDGGKVRSGRSANGSSVGHAKTSSSGSRSEEQKTVKKSFIDAFGRLLIKRQ